MRVAGTPVIADQERTPVAAAVIAAEAEAEAAQTSASCMDGETRRTQ